MCFSNREHLILAGDYLAIAVIAGHPERQTGTPQAIAEAKMTATTPVKQEAVVEDDDALSYFASLASDD